MAKENNENTLTQRAMKLHLPDIQVGREKATKYVSGLMEDLNLPIMRGKDMSREFKVDFNGKALAINPESEIASVMEKGKANILQFIFDSKDTFLNTPLTMGVICDVPGLKINMASNYGTHSSSCDAPGLIESPEVSFSEDIVFHRKSFVASFNSKNLIELARHYRGYLASSISLVDCFLFRYVFHIKNLIPSTADYENTKLLDSRMSIEERLDAWMTTFACHKKEEFLNSKERSKFIEIKNQRNLIVHPTHPTISYSVKDMVKYLNCAKDGVGGLLTILRQFSGYSENIGFIRRVYTMQPIYIEN